MHNQKGISSLVLLIVLVFGIFIIWELNEYIQFQTTGQSAGGSAGGSNEASQSATLCLTGEEGNCNDSNDQFLLP